jgi:cytochrome b561/polyisoprenoid-binding protein YceI
MSMTNTHKRYGSVSKSLHWLTALLIVTAFPLGMIANGWAFDSSESLATKAWLFSLHKTVGVSVFFVALVRITWAFTQPRPAGLHPERRVETFLAEAVHWLLYISLVIVPLTGWIHHAATTGFAPIWWPFGQTLPFVPQTPTVEYGAAAMHWLFTKLLALSIVLHVAGALKHHFIDRDGVLRRMLPGSPALQAFEIKPHKAAPAFAAFGIYIVGAAFALSFLASDKAASSISALVAPDTQWEVESGSLQFTVTQMNSPITGSFPDWTASITFDESLTEGRHGEVTVVIAIDSMTLGSVTSQAKGAEFFNAQAHPTAQFEAEILPAADGYVAEGSLTLAGASVPVSMPFALEIADGRASMEGSVTVDRRSFGMGESYPDEGTVGFAVKIDVALVASRSKE